MKIEIIRETLKNKSLKKEFALITNLINGDSEIFIPGINLSGMFSKYLDEIEMNDFLVSAVSFLT